MVLRALARLAAASSVACTVLGVVVGCGGTTTDGPGDAGSGGDHGGSGSESGASSGASSGGPSVGEAGPTTPPPIPTPVDKVDLLFDIDNSASMADKQQYLAQAIPDLIDRLVRPNCLDGNGNPVGVTADTSGHCTMGTAEFAPVHDLHVGIVSSSLGPRLGGPAICPSTGSLSQVTGPSGVPMDRHNDDQGHLLNRAGDPSNPANYTTTALPDAAPSNFLTWFPAAASSGDAGAPATGPVSIGDPVVLQADFQKLVTGVQQFGCGIESQLESWYRFLVQPDPYASLAITSNAASWVGFDTVLLAQRADFLRPDSLVAVIVLSDENDSEVDVRSFGGSGWNFMSPTFQPPRGTAICATNPNDPNCTSCSFTGHQNDPSCMLGHYTAPTDWGFDLNLRHVHEQQKYGVSVQFPIQRYLVGLTSPTVPNRDDEYPASAVSYQGLTNRSCTNPLFAAKLPSPAVGSSTLSWQPTPEELCKLPRSGRPANFIYYSHIGGVPHQLLQQD
ncbi:MAG TPA: hypothetical protein VH044_17340, partial [Polyangiaceae bacterium]|nr:hypothetical protein [Polyangiaceae bacterium]